MVGYWGLDVTDDVVSSVPISPRDDSRSQINHVGVLGATSLVGDCLRPLLTDAGWQVTAYSRRTLGQSGDGVEWRRLSASALSSYLPLPSKEEGGLPFWICVAPIWVLPDYFNLLNEEGARRVVVLSSTSRFTKDHSTDPEERATALRLSEAERRVREWAVSHAVEWVILRPTLIYGLGRDKNITEIARFIRRFGFFPLFGKANGLRQPIHAADVAGACLTALQAPCAANRAYNIPGGETLTYRSMVTRIFFAVGCHLRLLTVPLWVFSLAVSVMRHLPHYHHWSTAMAERMNHDLVFDDAEAVRDLGFKSRMFALASVDLPP